MSTTRFKFIAEGGRYAVRDTTRPLPGYIGFVQKYERYYNLQRPFTVRGWTAILPSLDRLRSGRLGEPTIFTTRQKAAEALAAEADKPAEEQ